MSDPILASGASRFVNCILYASFLSDIKFLLYFLDKERGANGAAIIYGEYEIWKWRANETG